jgi:hypothetical protein
MFKFPKLLIKITLVLAISVIVTIEAKSDCNCLGNCLLEDQTLGYWYKNPQLEDNMPSINFHYYEGNCDVRVDWKKYYKQCCPNQHDTTGCNTTLVPYYKILQISVSNACDQSTEILKLVTLEISRYLHDYNINNFELYKKACWKYVSNQPPAYTLEPCDENAGCCTQMLNMTTDLSGIVHLETTDLNYEACISTDTLCSEICDEQLNNIDEDYNPLYKTPIDHICGSTNWKSTSYHTIQFNINQNEFLARYGVDLTDSSHFTISYMRSSDTIGTTLPNTFQTALKKILYKYSLNVQVRDTFTLHIPRCWHRTEFYTSVCSQINECCDLVYEVYRNGLGQPVFKSITSVSLLNPCYNECYYICPNLYYPSETELTP